MSNAIPGSPTRHEMAELLRKAALIIRLTGWTQKAYVDDGHYCVIGALGTAAGGKPSHGGIGFSLGQQRVLFRHASGVLAEATEARSLAEWNDSPGRTKEEVLAALEKAAELAEAT